ncbi:MAG: glycosyltransferase [Gammaproteobacteria bacterium]|nr:glycosyltransferase [Gammaproteobacteria bacterium]
MPSLHSIYAYRTIYNGFRNAFIDMGHEFRPLTADDDCVEVFLRYQPDLFITSSFFWHRKYLDFNALNLQRKKGMFTLVKVDFWRSPLSKLRVNEAPSVKDDHDLLKLIKTDRFGDAYFHVVEQEDERMDGFIKGTGRNFHTIPLAADKIALKPEFIRKFKADLSYIGTNLPDKREFFKQYVFPLAGEFDLKLYGQDWTMIDQAAGWIQRGGQYFNIPLLRSLRKPKLRLEDEAKIYASSTVSLNVHEKYQRQYGGDCNERTFKIPYCNGFQVVDDVKCISKYFIPDREVVIAQSSDEWLEKVRHYLKYPKERLAIIASGRERVMQEHTYHHRAKQMLDILLSGAKNER